MRISFRAALLGCAALAAASLPEPSPALDIAEARGDFYYDAQGNLIGHRHADLPGGLVRRPMSHREKFELMGIQLPPAAARLQPRRAFPKPAAVDDREELRWDKVIVKFVEGTQVRLRGGKLRADGVDLPEVDAVLARYPDAQLRRLFENTEERILAENKETGERISGRQLADLDNFYLLTFDTRSRRGVDLANELLALDVVETAYLEAPGKAPSCPGDIAPTTPSYVSNQDYLTAAPNGLDSQYAWAYHAGGDGYGSSFWIADLEWDWCTTHEDLDFDAVDVLNGQSGPYDAGALHHGTAVLGEIIGCNNAYGVTGMTPDVTAKSCDFDSEVSWAANIQTADLWLTSGEIMLLEIHILGPASGLTCNSGCQLCPPSIYSQWEYVPVEWDAAAYAAIQTATANGIIVVEAAGNGGMDLDSAVYGGWFNPSHDSGAIMVGAGIPGTHSPYCWSDAGSRVNVHGFGGAVYTTGYGYLFNGDGTCAQQYTHDFGGTSSASPMIVGAASSVQGIAKAKYGVTLSPAQMRTTLPINGTPQGSPTSRNIGPMPDLVQAINWIEPDVIASFVPAGWSYPAVPRATTDSNGGFVPLAAGALPGEATATYWNWNEQNIAGSYTPTINSPYCGLFLDNAGMWTCLGGNLGPGGWKWCGNTGPNFVKGGRHTLLSRADVNGVENEWSETNNDWARQYIWSPKVLALNTPAQTTWDPPRTSTGWGPWNNAQGVSGTTGIRYWHAFAVMPVDAVTDHDINLSVETPMNVPQQGFGTYVASSTGAGDVSDFVIVDRNIASSGTYWASAINWSGTGDKVLEFDQDQGIVSNPGINGPYTLGAGEIVDLHEILLAGGVATRVQIQWISGDADYGVSVHRDPSGFTGKWAAISGGFSDSYGPDQDEYVVVAPAAGAWHGIAVWKKSSASLNQAVTYNLIVSQLPNLKPQTPAGWHGPVVPRNVTDATTAYAPLPAALDGNVTTTSFNFCTFNQGPGAVASPWQTGLAVDDVPYWTGYAPSSTAQGGFAQWINTMQGLDPYSLVRGGRHHLRTDADGLGQIAELPETDNAYVEWFVWRPLGLTDQTPVGRAAPPLKNPTGYGPWYSNDGFATTPVVSWTGVGVLPFTGRGDYDLQLHGASLGSKDGFGATFAYSGDATLGAPDFCLVNYRLVPNTAYDWSAVNWNAATDSASVQQADAAYLGISRPGVQRYGPFRLDEQDVLDVHEFEVVVPGTYDISVNNLGGGTNVDLTVYDGAIAYHNKFTGIATASAAGDGGDEHLTAFLPNGFHAIVVYKNSWTDLPKHADYEIVVSTAGSVVDAPAAAPLPSELALSAPRPNPSDGAVQVELAVPAGAGAVAVTVYDLRGRRVAALVRGEAAPGRHLLEWDGRDAAGRRVSAGIYFIRLEADGTDVTRKVSMLH